MATATLRPAGLSGHVDALAVPTPLAGLVKRPRLFAVLDRASPVTLLAGPAGSGKTVLLASWLQAAELPGAVAWVGVERDESDATRFWSTVMDALRASGAIAPDDPLATLAPAPETGRQPRHGDQRRVVLLGDDGKR